MPGSPANEGGQQRVNLSAVDGWSPVTHNEDVLAFDEVLSKLEKADPRAARVVELRFFGGLREEEVADVKALLRTARRGTVEELWTTVAACLPLFPSTSCTWKKRPCRCMGWIITL